MLRQISEQDQITDRAGSQRQSTIGMLCALRNEQCGLSAPGWCVCSTDYRIEELNRRISVEKLKLVKVGHDDTLVL